MLKMILVGLIISVSCSSYAGQGQTYSWKSINFPDLYLRHQNFLLYLTNIGDGQAAADADFRIVAGLAGQCSSLESVNYPGWYLRHQGWRVKLAQFADDPLFKKDATFCRRRGLGDPSGISFESYDFPHHYIRHSNYEIWVNEDDGSGQFAADATFLAVAPVQPPQQSGGGTFDPGTNTVPASE